MKSIILTLILGFFAFNNFAQNATWRDVPASELNGVASQDLAERMRASMNYAVKYGFGAGFPTFYQAEKNGEIVYGTVLLPKSMVEFKDIPVTELGNVSLDNFQERVRQAMTWASNHGYAAGIPTFNHADYGRGIICGVMLIKMNKVVFKDVRRISLRKFNSDDAADWARVANDYASKNNYLAGFPTFHVANKGFNNEVFGVMLFNK